jgi:diacylglycerol kinase family enzyme
VLADILQLEDILPQRAGRDHRELSGESMHVRPLETNKTLGSSLFRSNVVEPRVAVLLNANARKVTAKVIRSLSHVVPDEDIFLSRSEIDCRRVVQTVLERRYGTVFLGGGDGTFLGFVNELYRQLEHRNHRVVPAQAMPKIGILKLGTGNSLASVVRASPLKGDRILDDVLRARANEVPGYRRLDLLMVEGKRTPFAGLGLDARVLNDYLQLKRRFGDGPLKQFLTGHGGYFSSVLFKTIPFALTQSFWFECEVINGNKGPAYRLGPDGEPVGEPIGPGETMHSGRLMMASAGTIPYYGYEFRMFPFAGRRPGMMQLRLASMSTPTILANLPRLWKGRWTHPTLQDFHATEVRVRFAKPMPLQLGGDAEGYRDQVTLGMSSDPVELVDFNGAVN